MKKLYTLIFAFISLAALTAVAQEPDYSTIDGICANYNWQYYNLDGDEVVSPVTIKKGTAENELVINGVFGKYELKGSFDPATANVLIPNQRVGFDPDKMQFLSFVHIGYNDDVEEDPMELNNFGDGDFDFYEYYGVVAEDMDGNYLLEDGFMEWGEFAFLFRTGEIPVTTWEDAGIATLFDGGFFTPLPRFGIGFKTPVELAIERSTETEGLYRLVNPWNSYFDKDIDSYLEFNISDPECVIIPTQSTGVVDEELGLASVQNFVGMYIAAGFGVDDAMAAIPAGRENEHICTYDDKNKVVIMPVNAAFTTFAKDAESYYNVGRNYGAADSYIVMPGGDFSGIDNVINDGTTVTRYYNLQGMPIEKPAPGQLVIIRSGNTTSKVVF